MSTAPGQRAKLCPRPEKSGKASDEHVSLIQATGTPLRRGTGTFGYACTLPVTRARPACAAATLPLAGAQWSRRAPLPAGLLPAVLLRCAAVGAGTAFPAPVVSESWFRGALAMRCPAATITATGEDRPYAADELTPARIQCAVTSGFEGAR